MKVKNWLRRQIKILNLLKVLQREEHTLIKLGGVRFYS